MKTHHHLLQSNCLFYWITNKKSIALFVFVLIFSLTSNAKVWRLNNWPGVDADFKGTLQNAIDSASSGDTIHIEQSPFCYGGATIAKKVVLIGAGYWLTENDTTQACKDKSWIEALVFNPGSQGSLITGLYIQKWYPSNVNFILIEINTDSISMQRNYIQGGNDRIDYGTIIKINGNRSGVLIQQNWIRFMANSAGGGYARNAIYINGIPLDIVIQNNFIFQRNISSVAYHNAIEQSTSGATLGLYVKNNVIWGSIYTYNSLHVNNILLSGTFYNGSGGLTSNNLCNGTQYPNNNNNQLNVNMANVFVDHDLYIDNGYILDPCSPAKNAGLSGGDCGAFSDDYGGNPYVLSGIPVIPSIFEVNFNATVISTGSLQINIKAKSNK